MAIRGLPSGMNRNPAAQPAAWWILLVLLFLAGSHAIAGPAKPSSQGGRQQADIRVFSSNAYGISFRYPAGDSLRTANEARPAWGYLGYVRTDFVQPGGVWIASVELPNHSYPKTDFGIGFFSIVVNTGLSRSGCARFAYPDPVAPGIPQKPPATVSIGENQFREEEVFNGMMDNQARARYYHIFRNDACYEAILGVGTSGYGSVDGISRVDRRAVFHRLEAILSTLTIQAVAIPVAKTPIRAFHVTPLGVSAPHSYRVAWNVSEQRAGPIFLRVGCPMGLTLRTVQTGGRIKHGENCQKPILLRSPAGTMVLRFSNHGSAGRQFVHVSLTLSTAGNHPASETRQVVVPPSVVIAGVFQEGLIPKLLGPVVLQQGQPVLMNGVGFYPLNTVWMGATRLNGLGGDYGNLIYFSVPESLPPGRTTLKVANGLGQSNAISVIVRPPTPPRIDKINGIPVGSSSKVPTIPFGGQTPLNIQGRGFLRANFLWIGPYSNFGRSDDGGMIYINSVSAPPGTYHVFIVNEQGKSNVAKIVIAPRKK